MTAIQAVDSRPLADITFGLRLAIGTRRSAWLRLALTAIGTGIGVLVLLIAASVPHIVARQHERSAALNRSTTKIAGVAPLHFYSQSTEYHGDSVDLSYVSGSATSPRPPGVSRLPGPGEVVLSPALKRLLDSSGGALLRPRVSGRVIGTIGSDGLHGPASLVGYLGVRGPIPGSEPVYSFGDTEAGPPIPVLLWLALVVGVVVLLFPIFVFVVTASRLAGAERDRRLAAIRLLGADARQIRRIAAGESVLGSLIGLLLGGGLFLALRLVVESQTVGGYSVFAADVRPSTVFIAVIVAGVPILAVGATLFALRHTVIEPLGVVREGTPPRRRLWWRAVLVIVGAGLLFYSVQHDGSRPSTVQLAGGIVLLLLGIPVLLPWLLQFVVGRAQRGAPALQLATGRLRQDSGTPARVVAGVAVVLAGAIALFTVIAAAQRTYGIPSDSGDNGHAFLQLNGDHTPEMAAAYATKMQAIPGVQMAAAVDQLYLSDGGQAEYDAVVVTCADLKKLSGVRSCRDGDTFSDGSSGLAGKTLRSLDHPKYRLHIPVRMRQLDTNGTTGDPVFTPGALRGTALPPLYGVVQLRYDWRDPDAIERMRNAAAPLQWNGWLIDESDPALTTDQKTFRTVKRGLYAGALLTLGMAAATLLVLAIEQVATRRRPLSVLAAAGVPRSMLARSVLWQNAIPLVLAVVVADATGLALGALLLRIAHQPSRLDWTDLAVLTGLTLAAVAVATALTLPAVRRATRPAMLRAE